MRNRHLPRLCTNCGAPLATQEDACWQCGARWAPTADRDDTGDRIAHELRTDADRWTDEGGSLAPERTEPAIALR